MSEKKEAPKKPPAGKAEKKPPPVVAAPKDGDEDCYEVVFCCNCGIEFGMTPEFFALRTRDGKEWQCPNGHPQYFVKSTAACLADAEVRAAKAEADVKRLTERNASLLAALEAVKAPPRPHHCWLCHFGRCKQPSEVSP